MMRNVLAIVIVVLLAGCTGLPRVAEQASATQYAFVVLGAEVGAVVPGNGALQSVLSALHPTVLFPPNVQALLAGHVHLFEVVSFSTAQPAQFVTGTGGDLVDMNLPSPLPAGTRPAPGAVVASMVATNRFGFMTMERDGAGWRMVARDARGAPMTSCTLFERRATCDPVTLRQGFSSTRR